MEVRLQQRSEEQQPEPYRMQSKIHINTTGSERTLLRETAKKIHHFISKNSTAQLQVLNIGSKKITELLGFWRDDSLGLFRSFRTVVSYSH